MAQPRATMVNGKQIIYRDVIRYGTETKFTLKQRFMILFGCVCITNTEIFLRDPGAIPVGQRSVSLIPWNKKKLMKAMMEHDKSKKQNNNEQKKGTTSGNP